MDESSAKFVKKFVNVNPPTYFFAPHRYILFTFSSYLKLLIFSSTPFHPTTSWSTLSVLKPSP